MWELTQRCGKWQKYLGNGKDIVGTYRLGKWLKYLGNGLDVWGMV